MGTREFCRECNRRSENGSCGTRRCARDPVRRDARVRPPRDCSNLQECPSPRTDTAGVRFTCGAAFLIGAARDGYRRQPLTPATCFDGLRPCCCSSTITRRQVESLTAIDEAVGGAPWPPIWAAVSAAHGRLGASELWQEPSRPPVRQCATRGLTSACAAGEAPSFAAIRPLCNRPVLFLD